MKIIKRGRYTLVRTYVCPYCNCTFEIDYGNKEDMENYVGVDTNGKGFVICPDCFHRFHKEEKLWHK